MRLKSKKCYSNRTIQNCIQYVWLTFFFFFGRGWGAVLPFNQDFCYTPQLVMGKALYIAVLCAQDELCEFVLNLGSVLSVQLEYCARIRN